MHHYKESGLENVWLVNGFKVQDTPYGRAVSVEDADQLHQVIAVDLANKKGQVSGREFRFMRTLLGMSQQSFANLFGLTEQAVSLWERRSKVPKYSDAAIRMLVLEKFNGDGSMAKVLERINTVDRLVNMQIIARERAHKWATKEQENVPEEVAA